MGIYSTITISRNAAIRSIINNIEHSSNEELQSILFAMFEGKPPFRNFWITDSHEEPDDQELESRIDINDE